MRKLFPKDIELDVIVESYVVKLRKPDARIYEKAFDALRKKDPLLKHSEVCFCDDLALNVAAAKRLGWHGIRVIPGREDEVLKELDRLKTRAKL